MEGSLGDGQDEGLWYGRVVWGTLECRLKHFYLTVCGAGFSSCNMEGFDKPCIWVISYLVACNVEIRNRTFILWQ